MKKRGDDFIELIRDSYLAKKNKNPNFSIRSYAKQLGIHASVLSALLSKKRPLTEKSMIRIGEKLGFTPEQIKEFEATNRQKVKKVVTQKYREFSFEPLDSQQGTILVRPEHYILLEFVRTEGFQYDVASNAKKLKMSPPDYQAAFESLVRVGLIIKSHDEKGNEFYRTSNTTNINTHLNPQTAKDIQIAFLEQSMSALKNIPIKNRNNTSMTIAVDLEDLEEAKEMIKVFRRKLCAYFERKNKSRTEVYTLSVSLFPNTDLEIGEIQK